jgi:type I restriction enzyme S subunit
MKAVAAGAAQPKLGIYKIKALQIPYPDILIQKRIADILSAYDDRCNHS